MGIMLLGIVPGAPAWQIALFFCNVLAFPVLLARIVSIGLAKSYPALVVWLSVSAAISLVPWFVRMDLLAYYWFYFWGEGFNLVLYLFTVLELYGKVLRNLPGIASVSRRVIPVIVSASAIASAALLAFEGHPVSYLDWLTRIDRTVTTSLVFFVLMITALLAWFPIRVSRNTVAYSIGYAAYLVPKGASLFLFNSGHAVWGLSGIVGMTMSPLCLLFWAVAVNRAGETAIVSPSLFHPHDEARLVTQLEAINRSLLRATHK